MRGFSLILIALVLLSGCEEQPKEIKQPLAHTFDASHIDLPPEPEEPPPPETIPEPEILEEDLFPDDAEIKATKMAADRLGNARARLKELLARKDIEDKTRVIEEAIYLLEDSDYSRIKMKTDKSSLPVKLNRIMTKDMVIPAILETGINSQIAGRVTALVYRQILSPNMEYSLLPAGTKIICDYEGLDKLGQTRLKLTCFELIRPDGVAVALEGMSGGDMSGRQGLIGEVDNRNWQKYGAAFVMSGLSFLSQTSTNWTSNDTVNRGANVASLEFGKVTSKIIEKNIDLKPIITVEAGTRIILRPLDNITFIEPIPLNNKAKRQANKLNEGVKNEK